MPCEVKKFARHHIRECVLLFSQEGFDELGKVSTSPTKNTRVVEYKEQQKVSCSACMLECGDLQCSGKRVAREGLGLRAPALTVVVTQFPEGEHCLLT